MYATLCFEHDGREWSRFVSARPAHARAHTSCIATERSTTSMPAPNRVLTPPPQTPSHVRALRPHDSTMPGSALPSLPPPPSTAVPFALARRALGVTLPPPTLRVPESMRTPPRSSVPPPLPH